MKRRVLSMLVAAALLAACGVEVGNPNGEKPKTGTAQVFFARSPASEAGASFDLSLASVQLRTSDAAEAFVAELSAASASVEILSLTDDDDVLAASSDAVPVGSYARLVVTFADGAPVVYRRAGGDAIEASFEDATARAMTIDADVQINAGESTAIVVSLDAERSLVARDDAPDRRLFRPLGEVLRRDRRAAYEGATDIGGATFVCAYYYEPQSPANPSQRPPPPGDDGRAPPPPPPSEPLRRRPAFATAAEVVKDASADCPNAFDRTPVRDGRYAFRHLPPGKYDFRIFAGDGFSEGPVGVQLSAPPPPPPGAERTMFR